MTSEQQEVLFEYLKYLVESNKCESKKVYAEKIDEPSKDIVIAKPRAMGDKPKSVIECCLHCGSVSIKKHGTTKGGVQRYICKDCDKSFSENYGLITHYTHLTEWQWKEATRGVICRLSLTEIAKNIGTSTSTAWSCRMKIYKNLKNIYGYCDTFNSIVEADGKYERISFKGCKNKEFFIDTLGRLPRHHRSKVDRIKYLESCGKYEELFTSKPKLLKEMVFSSQKNLTGLDTIDKNHQQVCILTAIDRSNNIYIEPVTAGTAKSHDVYEKLKDRISNEALLITDEHHSYKYFVREEKITHVVVNSKLHTGGAYNINHVNSLHSSMKRFLGSKEYRPATKYLDLYLMMFWWLEKNKDLSSNDLCTKLFDIMNGYVSNEARAKMSRVTIKSLVSRELPIDTKGFYPKCA